MGRDKGPKEGSYDFFDNVREYIQKADNAKIESTSGEDYDGCKTFSLAWESKLETEENANFICKQVINLNKSLPHIKRMSDDPNYKKDCGFLNYLLNLKLYNNVIKKNISVFNFYNELESHCSEELKYSFSTCEVYNINKDELDKMTILYNLHAKRNEILGIINSQENLEASMLLEPSTECFTKYTKGLAMCNNKKNNKFCDLLEIFKNNYEELYPKVETKRQGYSKYLKSLSENENTNIISTSVIGSAVGLIPLFGILYKFTPVGQLFKSNKRVATDGKRYNDDDMKKISLMDHEIEQLKFKQEAYNIKYQSV